jgi:hypothetical protein
MIGYDDKIWKNSDINGIKLGGKQTWTIWIAQWLEFTN